VDYPKAIPTDDGEPYANYSLGSRLFMKIAIPRNTKQGSTRILWNP
jgi:hypothetical protein